MDLARAGFSPSARAFHRCQPKSFELTVSGREGLRIRNWVFVVGDQEIVVRVVCGSDVPEAWAGVPERVAASLKIDGRATAGKR